MVFLIDFVRLFWSPPGFFQLQLPLRTRISRPRNGAFPSGASRWEFHWAFSLGGEVGKVAFFDVKVGDLHLEHNNEGLEDDFRFPLDDFWVPSCSIR